MSKALKLAAALMGTAGGHARAKALTPEERQRIARLGLAAARRQGKLTGRPKKVVDKP